MTDIPFLTLCRGQVPLDLLWEGQKFGPGWWVAGIGFEDAPDDKAPSMRDSENPDLGEGEHPIPVGNAITHFSPIVGYVAAKLLDVEHDIVVTKWVLVKGTTDRWAPVLEHQRHKLTLHLTNGRSRTWWGLSSSTIRKVDRDVTDFDQHEPTDEQEIINTRGRVTTIDLRIPVDEHDATPKTDGTVTRKRTSTIRIATVTEVETEMRSTPVTDNEIATMMAKHAEKTAERERWAEANR